MISLPRGAALATSVLILFGAPNASAQAKQNLSLQDALRLAEHDNPIAKVVKARVEGATARAKSASVQQDPQLTVAQVFGQNTGAVGDGLIISQTLEMGDKVRQRAREANGEKKAIVADAHGTLLDLKFQVQSSYYEALLSDRELLLAEDTLKRTEAFDAAAGVQYRAGDVARSNVVRSQIELSRAQEALEQAHTQQQNTYANLKSLSGLSQDTEISLTDTLKYSPESLQLNALIKLAFENRPELRSARMTLESRQAALHSARIQLQPDLAISANHSVVDPSTGGSTITVGLTMPLLDYGKIRNDAKSAHAAVTEQEGAVEEAERVALLDVATAFRNWMQARRTVEAFTTTRIKRSQELYEMAQLGYQKGANSYLEVVDAQNIYVSEQTDYLRSLAAYQTARAALDRATGGKIP